jgi:transcriptional regulator with XRE-family HTH domain
VARRKDGSKSPSEIVRRRVWELRQAKEWRQQDLADALKPFCTDPDGPNIDDRATIGKIEAGLRGISLDEAFALAAALSVAPVNLFMPVEPVLVAVGDLRIGMPLARAWTRGLAPLEVKGQDAVFYRTQAPAEEWRPEVSVHELITDLEVLQRRLREAYVPPLPNQSHKRKSARKTRGK